MIPLRNGSCKCTTINKVRCPPSYLPCETGQCGIIDDEYIRHHCQLQVQRQVSFSVAEPELGVVMEKFGSLLHVTCPLLRHTSISKTPLRGRDEG
jgi:hypothetical protein